MATIEQASAVDSCVKKDQHGYLTFTLGAEEYGIDILRVQEIKGYSAVTPIPGAPPWIKGVMNLRGTVVPVVDLRQALDDRGGVHAFHREHRGERRRARGGLGRGRGCCLKRHIE